MMGSNRNLQRRCHGCLAGLTAVSLLAACTAGRSTASVETSPAAAPTPSDKVPAVSTGADTDTNVPGHATQTPSITSTVVPTCLASLPEREKIALLVWPAVYSDDWDSARRVVQDVGVGGVLLMRPDLDEQQLTDSIADLDAVSALGVLVATDEEGGDVQRLRDIRTLPSQHDMSRLLAPADTEPVIARHAQLLSRIGVDVVLGPVVDVAPTDRPPALQRSRLFDGDQDAVSEYARAYVTGWESAGLLPTLKHYPGHGSASGDTHVAAGVTPNIEMLDDRDLVPYRSLADLHPAVLVGHLTVAGLTDDRPATASAAAIAYLRNQLGYRDALVISDSLDMAAADAPVPDAAVAAIAAGIDVVLVMRTADVEVVIDMIATAVASGEIPAARIDDAAGRVLNELTKRGNGCDLSVHPPNDKPTSTQARLRPRP